MGSFSKPKSTSTSGPAAYTAPFVSDALNQNQQVYNQTAPLLQGLTNSAVGAFNSLAPSAFGANSFLDGAKQTATGIANGSGNVNTGAYDQFINGTNPAIAGIQGLGASNVSAQNVGNRFDDAVAGGKYLNAQPSAELYRSILAGEQLNGNPYLQSVIDSTNASVSNQTNRAFGARGLGAGISTPYADLLSKNLASNEGALRYTNYNDAANRQLAAAGQSDSAFANERGLMDNASGRLLDASKTNAANSLAAQQFNAQQNLAQQQALGQMYNQNQTLGLSALQGQTGAANQNTANQLAALGQVPGLVDAQYAGVPSALGALGLAAELPFAGINAYNNGIAALTGATNTSNSTQKGGGLGSSLIGGVAGGIGSAIGGLFSDRDLKMNIQETGTLPDGLKTYEWNYIWGGPKHSGVMADEVAELRPWAMGPKIAGFATVDYSKLEGVN